MAQTNTFPTSGNAGVGTLSPNTYLYGTNGQTLFGTNPGLALSTSSKTWLLWGASTNNSFRIYEGGTGLDRVTVLPGGNVGIGTTSPSQILHVAKDGGTGGTQLLVQDLSATYPGGIFVGSYQGNAYVQPGAVGKAVTFWDYTTERMRISSGGNVGINNTSPSAKLQVTNGSVLFDGTTGTTPVSGAGTRMMWIPAKLAFRAGSVAGTEWDDANIGTGSIALGTNTKASGLNSFAAGPGTIASGNYSTAFGASTASGQYSTALGEGTASGISSIACGGTASGLFSTAIGYATTASGDYSTAFGAGTTARSYNSFVIGTYNYNNGILDANNWIPTEPLFVIGNGTGPFASSNAVTVLKNGNVGIGQLNPVYPLDVNGTVRANEVKVCVGTCDFVFDKNYNLMSIDSLHTYVTQNHHLPGIASAKEMEAEGQVSLGQLDSKLLQKVEELTLYIVQQQQAMADMKKQIEELKKK